MNLFNLENFPAITFEPNQGNIWMKVGEENALLSAEDLKVLSHGLYLLYTAINSYLAGVEHKNITPDSD